MFIDQHTTVLDPTCGAGTALAVAWRFGASEVRGLDFNDGHVETSRKLLNSTRMIMASETPEESKKLLDKAYPLPDNVDDLDLDI
jgi:hypothetical protein